MSITVNIVQTSDAALTAQHDAYVADMLDQDDTPERDGVPEWLTANGRAVYLQVGHRDCDHAHDYCQWAPPPALDGQP